MHSVNILDIQKETIRLLQNTQKILEALLKSRVVLDSDEKTKQTLGKDFLTDLSSTLANEEQKAKNMEMVIAVVGTMKAGKSTTINAIVGQEILPNRDIAMTTLPTLVTHKQGQKTPRLTFDNTQPLIDLSKQIIKKSEHTDIKSGYKFLGSKDAKNLLKKIKNKGKLDITSSYTGQDEIFHFLYDLNDLMRIAKVLKIDPPYSKYQSIGALPRIEVEFFHLKNASGLEHGKLSILDTPGPNEFGQNDALKKVFSTQLKQSSAILLVLDRTQLNSEADGDLREQVETIRTTLGERLFVLVNKIDDNNKNSMSEK